MRVLLTNNTLAWRGGTELYVRDLSIELMRRGHKPVVYCTHIGEIAAEIRDASVPVITRLDALGEAPGVIHAHHNYEAVAALTQFPQVPAVSFCHGWFPWEERPLRFPQVRHYVAVSELTRERLLAEGGIPPERISIVPNFFDARLFPPRLPLPSAPRRAVSISNAMGEGELAAVRAACRRAGIQLDAIGLNVGRIESDMGKALTCYDLVFARGRSAIEAMAVGCAVILCDTGRLGPMVNSRNLSALRAYNFALGVLREPLAQDTVARAIGEYDATDATTVSAVVRRECELQPAVDRIVGIYESAIESASRKPPPSPAECNAALVRFLEQSAIHYKSSRLLERMREHEADAETLRLRAELTAVHGSATWRWSQKLLGNRVVQLLFGALIQRVAKGRHTN